MWITSSGSPPLMADIELRDEGEEMCENGFVYRLH